MTINTPGGQLNKILFLLLVTCVQFRRVLLSKSPLCLRAKAFAETHYKTFSSIFLQNKITI